MNAKKWVWFAIVVLFFIVWAVNSTMKLFEIETSEWFDAFSHNCYIIVGFSIFTAFMLSEPTEKKKGEPK